MAIVREKGGDGGEIHKNYRGKKAQPKPERAGWMDHQSRRTANEESRALCMRPVVCCTIRNVVDNSLSLKSKVFSLFFWRAGFPAAGESSNDHVHKYGGGLHVFFRQIGPFSLGYSSEDLSASEVSLVCFCLNESRYNFIFVAAGRFVNVLFVPVLSAHGNVSGRRIRCRI